MGRTLIDISRLGSDTSFALDSPSPPCQTFDALLLVHSKERTFL